MTENVKVESVKDVKVKKKRKIASLEKKKARAGWLFILPFVIGFVLIYIPNSKNISCQFSKFTRIIAYIMTNAYTDLFQIFKCI